MSDKIKVREWQERITLWRDRLLMPESQVLSSARSARAQCIDDQAGEYLMALRKKGVVIKDVELVERPSYKNMGQCIALVTLEEYADAPPPPPPRRPRGVPAPSKVLRRWSSMGERRRVR